MKKPVVDYTKLRFSNINSKEYRHLYLLLGWVVYFLLYLLTENLIPESACHVIYCKLDDLIPFNEFFLIFYVSWYFLVFLSLLYFALYDIDSFVKLQKYIIITQLVAMAIYIIYPSVQQLRPEVFLNDNFGTRLMSLIYTIDTPTGVCPSLHVAYSLGILSTWVKRKESSIPFKIFMIIYICCICISVSFVKQHSVIDIICAIPVCFLAEGIVFGKCYWKNKFKR